MSTSNEIVFKTTEVVPETATEVAVTTPTEVSNEPASKVITGHKKEYSIVGDALYASVSVNEAPVWLTGLIDSVVSTSIASGMTDYDSLVQDVRNAVDSIDVAKNTYVTQVEITPLVDGIITSRLETLNATNENIYATKVELTTAISTSELATTQTIDSVEASLNDTINSEVTNLQTALTTETLARSNDITALESSLTDTNLGLDAAASAVTSLNTYVGLDNAGIPNGTGLIDSVQSLSSFTVALENSINSNTASIAALEVQSSASADLVENKFAYGSVIKLNGSYYQSGFGLVAAAGGLGTEGSPYNSEFWINAQKFKFTNSGQTGQAVPFSIDASGTSPKLQMTGDVVIDGNVTGINNLSASNITTGTFSADRVNGGTLNGVVVSGNTIIGGTITGATISGNTISGGNITGTAISGGSITSGSAVMSNGNFVGLGFNGIRIKVGTFLCDTDGNMRVYFNRTGTDTADAAYSTEGMVWSNSSSGTPFVLYSASTRYKNYNQGQTTAAFSVLLGAAVTHMGPSTAVRDANDIKVSANDHFIFNRDDGYAGPEYFSYIAWGF